MIWGVVAARRGRHPKIAGPVAVPEGPGRVISKGGSCKARQFIQERKGTGLEIVLLGDL